MLAGAAVHKVGEETFRICDELLDDMVTVTNDEICSARARHSPRR